MAGIEERQCVVNLFLSEAARMAMQWAEALMDHPPPRSALMWTWTDSSNFRKRGIESQKEKIPLLGKSVTCRHKVFPKKTSFHDLSQAAAQNAHPMLDYLQMVFPPALQAVDRKARGQTARKSHPGHPIVS
jgi:hypothetical protein